VVQGGLSRGVQSKNQWLNRLTNSGLLEGEKTGTQEYRDSILDR
jgi:hypothetical protein